MSEAQIFRAILRTRVCALVNREQGRDYALVAQAKSGMAGLLKMQSADKLDALTLRPPVLDKRSCFTGSPTVEPLRHGECGLSSLLRLSTL